MASNKYRIWILHLDLGIGGAEQLIVTLAKLLQNREHDIHILTSHHDKNHCFEETKPNGVLGKTIEVYGDWLPRKLFGGLTAFFAIVRMIFLAFVMVFFYRNDCDLIIIDGVSAPIPILKLFGFKVLFYCHFPDLLLCTQRKSSIKQFYRKIVDSIEEYTTSFSDKILVNSEFTASVFKETFPTIMKRHQLGILYPVIPTKIEAIAETQIPQIIPYISNFEYIFISLNRYERKKNIEIALKAMKFYLNNSPNDVSRHSLLVIAGGYDSMVSENVEYKKELEQLASELSLPWKYCTSDDLKIDNNIQVVFRTSIPSVERLALFSAATALLYTPDKEHFGIVPLEAMRSGLPVIAVNSGGPVETIDNNITGYLCSQSGEEFGSKMLELMKMNEDPLMKKQYIAMKENAKTRVKTHFSEEVMCSELERFINEILKQNL